MSKLTVGGMGLGKHYKTLNEAVAASSLGDTIVVKKHHLNLTNTISIDHDVYIEGDGHTNITVADHIAGLYIATGSVTLTNLNFTVGQANAIATAPDAQGTLKVTNCDFIHDNKLSVREWFPLISITGQGQKLSQMSFMAHHSKIQYGSILAQQISVDQGCQIGDPLRTPSYLTGNQISVTHSTISNTVFTTWRQPVVISGDAITNQVVINGDTQVDGVTLIPILPDTARPGDIKRAIKVREAFKQAQQQYLLAINGSDEQDAQGFIQDITVNDQLVAHQRDLVDIAWLQLNHAAVTFKQTAIGPTNGLLNAAQHSAITLDQGRDHSEWTLVDTQVSDRQSDAPSLVKQSHQKGSDALKTLDGMIGLQPVKDKIHQLINTADVNMKLKRAGKPAHMPVMHMVFAGNAGTGKTTVARLVARALYEHGLLQQNKFVETSAKDMVAGYKGQSAKKTADLIQRAIGGVLFIDEAYQLNGDGDDNDFAAGAVDELIAEMENHRDNLVVIMAGYTSDMKKFFQEGNQGLQSRFANWIEFPDYTVNEMLAIADMQFMSQHLTLADDGSHDLLRQGITQLQPALGGNSGNGRFVRNLTETMVNEKNTRVTQTGSDDLLTINKADVQKGLQATANHLAQFSGKEVIVGENKPAKPKVDALKQLNSMPGLANVKQVVGQLVSVAKVNKMQRAAGLHPAAMSMHCVFAGNAGTGKTTVARLFGEALYQNGVLKSSNFHEVSAKDLIAGYKGQSADKTHAEVMKALDGVLFIDEAYGLMGDGSDGDFNDAAITQLIKDMEDYRDQLVVILAGYTEPMKQLITQGNQGFQSRIAQFIIFPDYTVPELEQILVYQLKGQHLMMAGQATWNVMVNGLKTLHAKGQTNGNGRFIRNYLQAMTTAKDVRIAQLDTQPTKQQLVTLTTTDAENGLAQVQQKADMFS